jgi:S-adenosylmethionine hydrolase
VELTNDRYWHHPVSQTFHGRDIFAPAAAHLAAGVPLTELGPPVHILERRLTETARLDHGYVYGTIVHIDRFGNAISNVPASMVPPNPVFEMSGRVLHGLARSYQEGPIVALVGSTGFVEIAARNGSAANALGLSVGDGLVVRSTR